MWNHNDHHHLLLFKLWISLLRFPLYFHCATLFKIRPRTPYTWIFIWQQSNSQRKHKQRFFNHYLHATNNDNHQTFHRSSEIVKSSLLLLIIDQWSQLNLYSLATTLQSGSPFNYNCPSSSCLLLPPKSHSQARTTQSTKLPKGVAQNWNWPRARNLLVGYRLIPLNLRCCCWYCFSGHSALHQMRTHRRGCCCWRRCIALLLGE